MGAHVILGAALVVWGVSAGWMAWKVVRAPLGPPDRSNLDRWDGK